MIRHAAPWCPKEVSRIPLVSSVRKQTRKIDAPENVARLLIEAKMRNGATAGAQAPDLLWWETLKEDPTAFQILTPASR